MKFISEIKNPSIPDGANIALPLATTVEGIFRHSGSVKRINDLQQIFDTPDKYGKGLDWSGYTVHDAANVLRRYLNCLPEPIIPLEYYNRFRDPLTQDPSSFNVESAIKTYQNLIQQLPDLNRQLLLYILDLLAVFASKSEHNLMDAANLAAIFQPGLLSHPSHAMAPQAYKLSQDVLVFLISHQDHFLIGTFPMAKMIEPLMPVTPATPTGLKHSKTVSTRGSIDAGGDESKKTGLRRNVSTGSRKSSNSPVIPRSGSSVSRSNTLPSRGHSGREASPRNRMPSGFRDGSSPLSVLAPLNIAKRERSPNKKSETSTTVDIRSKSVDHSLEPPRIRQVSGALSVPERGPSVSPLPTPSKEKKDLGSFFGLSPPDRPVRKLKKRIPGSSNPSAASSSSSLPGEAVPPFPSTLETVPGSPPDAAPIASNVPLPLSPPPVFERRGTPLTSPALIHSGIPNGPTTMSSSTTLMPTMSPTPSTTSSVTSQDSIHDSAFDAYNNASPKKDNSRIRSRWKRLSGGGKTSEWSPPSSPSFGHSNGSIAERIRESGSPPGGNRRTNSESSGDESRSNRSSLSWLPKGLGGARKSRQDKDRQSRSPNPHVERVASPPPSGPIPMPTPTYPPTPLAEPQVSPIEESVLENVADSMVMSSNDVTPKAGTSENTPTPKPEEKTAEFVPEETNNTKPSNAEVTADPVSAPPTADEITQPLPSMLDVSSPPPPSAPTTAAPLATETIELEKTTVASL